MSAPNIQNVPPQHQTPGILPPPDPVVPGAAPAAQPAPTPAAPASMSAEDIAALVQAAIAAQPQAQPQTPAANVSQPGADASFDASGISDPLIRNLAETLQHAGKGLDMDRAVGRAIAAGDERLIDVAYLREKGGDRADNIAAIATGVVRAVAAKAAATQAAVHTAVGGEAVWAQAVAVFNSTASPELRATATHMLNSTNDRLVQAGARLVADFAKASGAVPQAGKHLPPGVPVAGGQGLSKAQFQTELAALKQSDPNYQAQRAALYERRSLGKRVGL